MGSRVKSFAIEATTTVRGIAKDLSQTPGIKAFCIALLTELDRVSQWLTESPSSPETTLQTFRLLDLLEKTLGWPSRPRSSSKSQASQQFDPKWFPSLENLRYNKGRFRNGLKDFASSPAAKQDRVKLHRFLKKFEGPHDDIQQPELSSLLQQAQMKEVQDDYQAYLRALYKTLALNCLCQQDDFHRRICVNLRLKNCDIDGKTLEGVRFGLFFLDHPHKHGSGGSCQWRDTQFCVVRKRAVGFHDVSKDMPSNQHGKTIADGEFCRIISGSQQSQLHFTAAALGGLVWQGSGPLSPHFHLRSSSIPLARIIQEVKLSKKLRLLLACQIAKAVWQFYDSDWMRREWNKNTVHFMWERRSKTPRGIFVDEPFISADFDGEDSQLQDDRFRSHRFPKVLALGIMLLEIELGVNIKDYYRPECYDAAGTVSINATHIAAMAVLGDADLWEEKETFGPFRELIEICVTADPLKPHCNDPGEVRAALYKHVVGPLRQFYQTAWGDPEKTSVRPIEVQPDGEDHQLPLLDDPASKRVELSPRCAEILPSLGDSLSGTDSVPPSSDRWFSQFQKLSTITHLRRGDRDASCKPVKIAILDTGLDPAYSSRGTVGFRDFVDERNRGFLDSSGHGTSAFQLMQKVHKDAQIFIGRVWESRQATSSTASLMTRAIRHARTDWEVDVIAIPSGFQSEHEEMLEAIEEASAARILIFAAAANHGNLIDIAFPARMYRAGKLFCMFSTDTNARSLPGFNPSPIQGAHNSFAILGENIVMEGKKGISGTSFSAVIGAGLAARLIDFSRHPDTRGHIRRPGHLKRVEGMTSVFSKMAKADLGYWCIAPWRILPDMDDDKLLDLGNRSFVRKHVC